jgi:hypothetical protein
MPARQKAGVVLFAVGIGLTVVLALVSGAKQAPSQGTDVLLVLLIALTQGGAAWAFNGVGRADPTHAQQSARRLTWLARRASSAGQQAQAAFEGELEAARLTTELGIAATDFSWIEEGLVLAIEDWRVFHSQAVGDAEKARGGRDA